MNKVIAAFQRRTLTEDGDMEITFKVDKYSTNWINACKELINKPYAIEISKPCSERSLDQNAFLWQIIGDIAKIEDGHLTNEWDTYCALLEMASAKYEDIIAPVKAEETIRKIKGLRGIRIMRTIQKDNEDFYVYRLYPGSSTFNTKEMMQLIDVALDYAAQVGIDTTYYGGYLWKSMN